MNLNAKSWGWGVWIDSMRMRGHRVDSYTNGRVFVDGVEFMEMPSGRTLLESINAGSSVAQNEVHKK